MGIHHLISIGEDQLRNWQGDPDELLRNIGSAVVLACFEPDISDVTIRVDKPDGTSDEDGPMITVSHVDKHDGDEFAVWAWAAGDEVCIADLPEEGLALLCKLSNAVLHGNIIGR